MQVRDLKDGECLRAPLSVLVDAPWGNVRKGDRDAKSYEDLKRSVEQTGVLQAITVRPNDEDNTLEVLAGYGRRKASEETGKADIPVVCKRVNDSEGIAIGLAENLNREKLSIVDEIRVSQEYVSAFGADYDEAAKALGWPVRTLKGRLKLNDCTAEVLQSLREGAIKIGHAEVLCQFTEKLQNGTLKKILDQKWTVERLKERANKAVRLLRFAQFDTEGCKGCPHNSDVQAQLFDNSIGEAKCVHLPCYREKTEAWVEARKAELEKEEGKVFLAVEKPPADRNLVSVDVVGEKTYTEECLSCVHRVRVLQDGINRDCGTVIDNQCVNLSCFKEKVDAHRTDQQGAPKKKAVSKKGATKSPTTVSKKGVITAAMKEQSRAFARKTIGSSLMNNESYRLAVILSSVAEITGYTPKGRSMSTRSENVARLAALKPDDLQGEIDAAIRFGTLEADLGQGRFGGTDVVLASRKHIEDAKKEVTDAWEPTKAWFDTYQKGAIEGFCRQRAVGFASAFDKERGKGEFAKLMKRKKADLIDTILAFNFDWSAVAPKEVLELVK